MSLWNTKNLSIPPINTYKASNKNIDIKHLRNVLDKGIQFFNQENHMKVEYAVMSRIIYRMKQKIRSAKDFKALEKVHKALDNYFKTNMSSDLKSFVELVPFRYTEETYLPNKSIADYILVRLQGLIKLMERIVETCKITAYLFHQRICLGHFWKIALITFSVVSRIYILAKNTAKFICEFYTKILPFSRQLKNSGRNWLPDNYILPTDLKQWMNVDWLDVGDELEIIEAPALPNIVQFFNLVDDDDDDIQFCDEYIMVNDDEDVELMNEFKSLESNSLKHGGTVNDIRGFNIDEDVGEVIEVEDDSILFDGNEMEGNISSDLDDVEINSALHVPDKISDVGEVVELGDSLKPGATVNDIKRCHIDRDVGKVIEINDDSIMFDRNEAEGNISSDLDDDVEINSALCVPDISDVGEIIELEDSLINDKDAENDATVDETKQIITILDNSFCSKSEENTSPAELKIKSRNIFKMTNDYLSSSSELKSMSDSRILRKANKKKESNITVKKKKHKSKLLVASKKKVKCDEFRLQSKVNRNTMVTNKKENIVLVTDSSIIGDDTMDKIAKKKKLKFSKRKNKPNVAENARPTVTSSKLNKTENNTQVPKNQLQADPASVIEHCNKKKKKKRKTLKKNVKKDMTTEMEARQIKTKDNKKRKLEDNSEDLCRINKKPKILIDQTPTMLTEDLSFKKSKHKRQNKFLSPKTRLSTKVQTENIGPDTKPPKLSKVKKIESNSGTKYKNKNKSFKSKKKRVKLLNNNIKHGGTAEYKIQSKRRKEV